MIYPVALVVVRTKNIENTQFGPQPSGTHLDKIIKKQMISMILSIILEVVIQGESWEKHENTIKKSLNETYFEIF